MLYVILANVYSLLFYAIYFLFLKNGKQHVWSRAYLLLCAILPLLLPFAKLAMQSFSLPIKRTVPEITLPVFTIADNAGSTINTRAILSDTVLAVYILVSCLLLLRFIASYVRIRQIVGNGNAENYKGIKLVRNTNAGPGSWRKYILLPGNDVDPAIFDHEMAHIKLKHSRDLHFIYLLQCFCWPNLTLFGISKELRTVHEFQADEYACLNKQNYTEFLLNQAFNTNKFLLSNTFFQHPLNRRIMMLKNNRSKAPGITKAVVFISTLCLFSSIVIAQAVSKQKPEAKQISQQKPSTKIVLDRAEKMPQFPGSVTDFLSANIKYPAQARQKNIQGRVIVKFTIDDQGNVVDPQIVNSPDNLLSSAALKVVKSMPKWRPGEEAGQKVAVHCYLPILFKL